MISEITHNIDETKAGWVLYDGHCGFCSTGIRRAAALLRCLGYAAVPLQTPWVAQMLGHDPAIAPQEMALLTRDGRLLGGVDAYLHIANQLWWARPFAHVARIAIVHRLLRGAYRWIADHRARISSVCRLRPDLPREKRGAP